MKQSILLLDSKKCSIYTFRTSDVRDFFKVFGELRDVYLPKDYYTKETKGVAYVE